MSFGEHTYKSGVYVGPTSSTRQKHNAVAYSFIYNLVDMGFPNHTIIELIDKSMAYPNVGDALEVLPREMVEVIQPVISEYCRYRDAKLKTKNYSPVIPEIESVDLI